MRLLTQLNLNTIIMKKILIMMFVAATATNINAQLVVDSLGRVGIGTNTPSYALSVSGSGNGDKTFYCSANGKEYGIYTTNYSNVDNSTYGYYSNVQNNTGNCFGGKSIARGNGSVASSQYVIGMAGVAGMASTAVGLYGGKISTGTPVNFAGVYGTESQTTNPSFSNYSGTYAGFFKGKVRVTNGIYATVLSPSASPSPSGQGGTTVLSDRGESVTDKLSQVQAVQFLRYDPTKEEDSASAKASASILEDLDIDNMSPEEMDSLSEAMGDVEPERYLSPIQYGLDADQLKAVYPELVYEDDNGNVSINYVEMVPLLVQSIKELKAEIAELKGTSAKKAKTIETTGIEETVSDVDMVRMDQNKPNPFSESTVITLNIPEQTQKANIFIYDMSGKQVQNIAVSERGETNITVYASDLTAGMYIYTLVVDGKVSVTRRMIVSI